jgi:hypothetical protein
VRSLYTCCSRFVLALPFVLVTACVSTRPPDQSVFSVLPGRWASDQFPAFGCGGNWQEISFTRDRKLMLLKFKEESKEQEIPASAVRYHVLQAEPNLRMAIEGEKRVTPTGEPVVWDVVMLTPDKFCWHRADWEPGACTPALVRCPITNSAK